MKKIKLLIVLTAIFSTNAYCVKMDTARWDNLINAIEIGTTHYVNYDNYKYSKYAVFIIKVISIGKTKGEFSISYILNDDEYININPSNYLMVDDRLVLIRTDSLKTLFTSKSGYNLLNESIVNKAFDILAGPNISITGQPSPVMVVNYKRKKVTTEYFKYSYEVEDKYHYFNDIR